MTARDRDRWIAVPVRRKVDGLMTEQTELLPHAVNKLRDAIHPITQPQPVWDNGTTRTAQPLYTRMRTALTAATPASTTRLQASKAPARIDVLAWFCDIDTTVGHWLRAGDTTTTKLELLYNYAWTPHHLKTIKAMTRRCENWVDQAKHLLQDNPPEVPLRKPCPRCGEFWHYSGSDKTRAFALRVSEHGAQCHACKARWISNQEISVFIQMLGA